MIFILKGTDGDYKTRLSRSCAGRGYISQSSETLAAVLPSQGAWTRRVRITVNALEGHTDTQSQADTHTHVDACSIPRSQQCLARPHGAQQLRAVWWGRGSEGDVEARAGASVVSAAEQAEEVVVVIWLSVERQSVHSDASRRGRSAWKGGGVQACFRGA